MRSKIEKGHFEKKTVSVTISLGGELALNHQDQAFLLRMSLPPHASISVNVI